MAASIAMMKLEMKWHSSLLVANDTLTNQIFLVEFLVHPPPKPTPLTVFDEFPSIFHDFKLSGPSIVLKNYFRSIV